MCVSSDCSLVRSLYLVVTVFFRGQQDCSPMHDPMYFSPRSLVEYSVGHNRSFPKPSPFNLRGQPDCQPLRLRAHQMAKLGHRLGLCVRQTCCDLW